MARRRLQAAWDSLGRVLTQPRDELDRWEKALRYTYDLFQYGARQLRQDRAPQMAGALAFRTLFGLLPVLVVGTMLVKALGGFEQFRERLAEFFASLRLDTFIVTPAAESDGAARSLSDWLLDQVALVQNVNLTAITWVGVAVLIYSALSLMVTIENGFNSIYRAPEGRSWLRRLPIYWTVLTLGPGAIALTMYMSSLFDAFFTEQGGWWAVFRAAPVIWSFLATWIVTFALYKLIPNTIVTYRPAMAGAFVAAVLLEIGKRTLGFYFQNAISFSQLYGSLGLIPVFMFWVYIMWLVILFGLEVSATLQMLGGRRLEEIEAKRQRTGLIDPASVLVVMEVLAEHFAEGRPASPRQVAEASSLPEATVAVMLERLVEQGLVHRLDREDGAYSLARPPESIPAEALMRLGFSLVDEGGTGEPSAILLRLREVQLSLTAEASLASLRPLQPILAGADQGSGTP